MFGNGCPALNASSFRLLKLKWIGLKTVFVTTRPVNTEEPEEVDRN